MPDDAPTPFADTIHYQDGVVVVHKVVVGPVDNNVFVVRCKETGDAVLLDAANEHDLLLELCQGLGVRTVLETHGHWDHIQAIPAIRNAGYEVGITAEDIRMMEDGLPKGGLPKDKAAADPLPSYDFVLEDESVVEVGRLRLHTVATPGHTPGSMCFRVEGTPLFFAGDTLFPGGPGNTSFAESSFDTIMQSLDRRIFSQLPDDTIVLPGHGDDTTIGAERPHLDEWAARGR